MPQFFLDCHTYIITDCPLGGPFLWFVLREYTSKKNAVVGESGCSACNVMFQVKIEMSRPKFWQQVLGPLIVASWCLSPDVNQVSLSFSACPILDKKFSEVPKTYSLFGSDMNNRSLLHHLQVLPPSWWPSVLSILLAASFLRNGWTLQRLWNQRWSF